MFFTPVLAVVGVVTSIIISLVIAAISIVLSELLRPKPKIEDARPNVLGDFTFPTAIEGRVVPIVFGTVKLTGPNVVWFGDFRQVAVKQTVKTGLWSKKKFVKGYRYYFGMQLGLCRGPIDAVTKIWIGEDVVFSGSTLGSIEIDEPKLFGGEDFGQGGIQGRFRIVAGDEVQFVDAYLLTQQGATTTPAYRGSVYGVWIGPSEDVPGGSTFGLNGFIGTQTSITAWHFEVQRFPNTLAIPAGGEIVNTFDANPLAVAYELLTNDDWGLGLPASKVDVAGFRTAATLLASEGNGFSWVMDNQIEAADFLKEIERQIDGVIFFDQLSGQFKINLARGIADINLIPQVTAIDGGNVIEVKDFTRGTWDETVNQLRVGFADRSRDYFQTFAPAPDLANLRIQQGEQVQAEVNFPGVKEAALAAKIASRELRGLSVPLAKAQVIVDRTLFALTPLEAVAFTDSTLDITQLPMRVMGIDFGNLEKGQITLSLVQDVFGDFSPFTAPNDPTLWVAPIQDAEPIPLVDSLVFEAPRGFQLARDESGQPGTIDRIWSGGRTQTGQEIMYRTFERNAPASPGGPYREVGEIFDFFLIGTLGQDIFHTRTNPQAGAIRLDASPDVIATMVEAFEFASTPSASDIGQSLVNLIVIGDEFLAVRSVVDQTTFIQMFTVYSGLLDTVVADHAQGVPVYLLFAGGGLTDSAIPRGHAVDFQLRPESRDTIVSEFSAPEINLTMNDRARRPYPPTNLFMNTASFPSTLSIDDVRPTFPVNFENRGIDIFFVRRDFRTTDEVQALGVIAAGSPPTVTDAADFDPTFPVANNTEYQMEVIDDPLGAATSLFTTPFDPTNNIFLVRTKILRETGGTVPVTLGIETTTRHDFEGETFLATQLFVHDFGTTSGVSVDTNMGVIAQNVISGIFTMNVAGPATITLNIGTAFGTGVVEARVNGGGFSTVIAAGLVTGTIPGIVLNDTIEVRHTEPGIVPTETFLQLVNPANLGGYAILTF